MRITLTLDPDVADKAKRAVAKLRKPINEVVNDALREGLDAILRSQPAKPYQTKPRPPGLRAGPGYEKISELLQAGEGENHK